MADNEKSGTETPEELTIDPAERGGAAWMAVCEKQLGDDDGCERFWVFLRKWKKKGGDIEKLNADLVNIAFGENLEELR